jgi:hypothetical protein
MDGTQALAGDEQHQESKAVHHIDQSIHPNQSPIALSAQGIVRGQLQASSASRGADKDTPDGEPEAKRPRTKSYEAHAKQDLVWTPSAPSSLSNANMMQTNAPRQLGGALEKELQCPAELSEQPNALESSPSRTALHEEHSNQHDSDLAEPEEGKFYETWGPLLLCKAPDTSETQKLYNQTQDKLAAERDRVGTTVRTADLSSTTKNAKVMQWLSCTNFGFHKERVARLEAARLQALQRQTPQSKREDGANWRREFIANTQRCLMESPGDWSFPYGFMN